MRESTPSPYKHYNWSYNGQSGVVGELSEGEVSPKAMTSFLKSIAVSAKDTHLGPREIGPIVTPLLLEGVGWPYDKKKKKKSSMTMFLAGQQIISELWQKAYKHQRPPENIVIRILTTLILTLLQELLPFIVINFKFISSFA